MKRFILAAAFALVGAVGFANTAHAQYVYGYRTYVPGAGVVVQSQTYATPFGVQSSQGYYSPYNGFSSFRSNYSDAWGNQSVRVSGYNPYTNYGYRSGYSVSPYGYSTYNRSGFGYRW